MCLRTILLFFWHKLLLKCLSEKVIPVKTEVKAETLQITVTHILLYLKP